MTIRSLLAAICLASLVAWAVAQEALPVGGNPLADAPPTDARHYSYAIGQDLGANFRNNDVEIDVDSFAAGLRDALTGAEPKYSEDLCTVAIQRMYQAQEEKLVKRNEEYFAKNAKAEGVTTLPSGLQYKVLAAGAGPSPKATDRVRVNYVGKFTDGTTFDESGDEPAEFQVDGVIPGWTEALLKMKVGDKWQLFVPSDLAYGPKGDDVIPPHAILVFEVELLGIQ